LSSFAGICEFNLEQGELDSFHHLIDPHPLPHSQRGTALYTAAHVHGLDESIFAPV
jgi:hypothetical protein